jgi:Flp pilus assembly pilin Flp
MSNARHTLRRFARDTSGTALVEMAIVLPLALSLMIGGVEFGRVLSVYSTADKSVRNAARYLARVPETGVCSWGLTYARNLALYGVGNPGQDDEPLIASWTAPGSITLTAPACGSFTDDTILVLDAAVPFDVFMLSALPGLSNSFTLSLRHEERHVGE